MKKLGLCVLVLAGLFSLAGCNLSGKSLSDEQIDKLMYLADNADNFMDESLKLLDSQKKELDIEEGYRLYQTALVNFDLNVDGIRDNVIIEGTEDGTVSTIQYFKTSDGKYVYLWDITTNEGKKLDKVVYTDNNIVYSYNSGEIESYQYKYGSVDEYLLDGELFMVDWLGRSKDAITKVKLLEGGNYELTFVVNDINLEQSADNIDLSLSKFVVSKDAKIISLDLNIMYSYKWSDGEMFYNSEKSSIKFIYGGVDENYINSQVAYAKANGIINN